MNSIKKIQKILGKINENPEEKYKILEEEGLNYDFYWAYRITTQETKNELLDFDDLRDSNIPNIVENLKEFGIKEFTISSKHSRLNDVLAAFIENGYSIDKMTKITYRHYNCETGDKILVNAIKMKINEEEEI